ncbi:MAG: hypothetical protein JO180_01895 [Gemmatirosa sp.]|nr:hypothetical protein [Gemmatirosa sp.]
MPSLPLLVALIASLSAPPAGLPSGPCDRMRGQITDSDGARTTLTISDDTRCLSVRMTGRAEFTDDDADVKSLEPGSTFVVTESRAGGTRMLSIVERSGRLEREYTVNGAPRPSAESVEWLRGIVLDVVRATGYGAEARVARIRRQSGVGGVLDEVARLRSDHVRRIYLEQLMQGGRLSEGDLRRVAQIAGQRIGSDHDKSEVLQAVTDRVEGSRDVAAAVVAAAETIGSDHDRMEVLQRMIERAPDGDALLVDALDAARGIGSDHDRGQVLATVVGRSALGTPAVRAAFFRALDAMGSDHDRMVVLQQVVGRDATSQETARAVLASAARLGSDHDKSTVLLAVAARSEWMRDATTRAAFDAALKTVGSDSDYRRVREGLERRM